MLPRLLIRLAHPTYPPSSPMQTLGSETARQGEFLPTPGVVMLCRGNGQWCGRGNPSKECHRTSITDCYGWSQHPAVRGSISPHFNFSSMGAGIRLSPGPTYYGTDMVRNLQALGFEGLMCIRSADDSEEDKPGTGGGR